MENDLEESVFLEKLIRTTPSERQLAWQQLRYFNFIHFGMNTLTNKEWGDGTAPASAFNIPYIDTDQWVSACKASGSAGVIFTAKHHDGFCLFPSKYTDYSVAHSPYLGGKGDVVKQVAESCAKYGMKFGIYLSPWDRHEPTYGTPAYNDYYVNQLTELLGGDYGEIFEVWLDGANDAKLGAKWAYDFDRYFETIRTLQPNAVIANCGPDVRWIGNEGGKTRDQEWNVVSARLPLAAQRKIENGEEPPEALVTAKDLGSRKALREEKEFVWYPAECDTPIVPNHWFWHPIDNLHVLPAKKLVKLYRNTVGRNASLLLNVSPNRKGVLPAPQVKALAAMGSTLANWFRNPVFTGTPAIRVTEEGEYCYEVATPVQTVNRIVLQEDLQKSQRIEKFTIEAWMNEKYVPVYNGECIGSNHLAEFTPVATGKWRIVIKKCRVNPYLLSIKMYSDTKK